MPTGSFGAKGSIEGAGVVGDDDAGALEGDDAGVVEGVDKIDTEGGDAGCAAGRAWAETGLRCGRSGRDTRSDKACCANWAD